MSQNKRSETIREKTFTIIKSFLCKISAFFHFLEQHNGVITGTATVALAIITYAYLNEVREQRVFSYKQIALQNVPELLIVPEKSLDIADPIRTSVTFRNQGGTLENLQIHIHILCCSLPDTVPKNVDTLEHHSWKRRNNRLGRNENSLQFLGIPAGKMPLLEAAIKDETRPNIVMYVSANYQSQPNPIQEPISYSDSASFWWNPTFKRWMNLSSNGHDLLTKLVTSKKL